MDYQESFPLWKDVLHFTYYRNEGAAFGSLKDHRWVFMVFSTIAIIGLTIYLFKYRPKSKFVQITLAMIIGGGIGNMIDRIFLGYVIDFVDFTLINFAIFNMADAFITVGAFMLMGYLLREIYLEWKQIKSEKKTALTNEESTESTPQTEEETTEDPQTEQDHGTDSN